MILLLDLTSQQGSPSFPSTTTSRRILWRRNRRSTGARSDSPAIRAAMGSSSSGDRPSTTSPCCWVSFETSTVEGQCTSQGTSVRSYALVGSVTRPLFLSSEGRQVESCARQNRYIATGTSDEAHNPQKCQVIGALRPL